MSYNDKIGAKFIQILRDLVGPTPNNLPDLKELVNKHPAIVSLARNMEESRDFSIMPILADALEEAGCADQALLAHCRRTSPPHVLGDWVLDAVLGRELTHSTIDRSSGRGR